MKGNRSEAKTYWFSNHLAIFAHVPSCAALAWRPCFAPLQRAGPAAQGKPVPGISLDGSLEGKQNRENTHRLLTRPACDLIKMPPNAGLPIEQACSVAPASLDIPTACPARNKTTIHLGSLGQKLRPSNPNPGKKKKKPSKDVLSGRKSRAVSSARSSSLIVSHKACPPSPWSCQCGHHRLSLRGKCNYASRDKSDLHRS